MPAKNIDVKEKEKYLEALGLNELIKECDNRKSAACRQLQVVVNSMSHETFVAYVTATHKY